MSSRRLKFAVNDHYRESLAFVRALLNAGHELVSSGPADLLLIDLDPPLSGYQKLIKTYHDMGAKVVLYPHGGGGPVLSYDGLWEPDPRIAANLLTGPGQAEFMRRIQYPSPTHTVGWSYCEMLPFRACDDVQHVCFAPTHPNADGSMAESRRALNSEVYARLLEGPWRLTVRHIGTLEQNGLWEADGVEFVNGRLQAETAEIDVVDAVVAGDGTFPTLAIARGVPTVMYGQATLALGLPDEELIPPQRADLYMDYIRYPFDFADGPLEEIVHAAARSEAPIVDWKRRFVGEPFDARAAVAIIEQIVNGPAPLHVDESRRFTTLGLVDEMLERPELLRAYTEAFGPEDDATLILWAPGVGGPALLDMAERAIEAAGIDGDALPDILLTPLPGSPEAELQLAERADALLSEWPSISRIGELPKFGAGDSQALRAASAPLAVA